MTLHLLDLLEVVLCGEQTRPLTLELLLTVTSRRSYDGSLC